MERGEQEVQRRAGWTWRCLFTVTSFKYFNWPWIVLKSFGLPFSNSVRCSRRLAVSVIKHCNKVAEAILREETYQVVTFKKKKSSSCKRKVRGDWGSYLDVLPQNNSVSLSLQSKLFFSETTAEIVQHSGFFLKLW